jgi:AraC-like DNA-binding protein
MNEKDDIMRYNALYLEVVLLMQYMTIKQAAQKWGVQERQIQTLCSKNRIDGAIRFNRSWAIPKNASKPNDKRRRLYAETAESGAIRPGFFEGIPIEYLSILNDFPLKINISDRYGSMVYANEAFFEKTLDEARRNAVGVYNIREENALESWGLKEHVEKAFRGERVLTRNLKFPNRDLEGVRYGKDFAFTTIYNDIYSYPIFSHDKELLYVVSVFVPVRTYEAREEVSKAKEHIENHWQEPYSNAKVARSANLSPSNLLRLFKADTGFTPREYYVDFKLNKIMEKLMDLNLSASQAFAACGVDYNSHYVRLFRKKTGMSPIQYRKSYR